MHDESKLTAAIIYGFIGGIAGAVALAILLVGSGILSVETKTIVQNENFWREWIGATSGWVAAFVAALVGWTTLRPILVSLRHQQVDTLIQSLNRENQSLIQLRNIFGDFSEESGTTNLIAYLEAIQYVRAKNPDSDGIEEFEQPQTKIIELAFLSFRHLMSAHDAIEDYWSCNFTKHNSNDRTDIELPYEKIAIAIRLIGKLSLEPNNLKIIDEIYPLLTKIRQEMNISGREITKRLSENKHAMQDIRIFRANGYKAS
ncbi:hypothetical protein [Cohaesibacter gelatinilyticus]|uniref:Phage abortive infection protein n=1 Tax=Cohaesibacter gelatinilyticus TaxID=372072 RepID=A0A285NBH1_9HYPH|nr:hypothetical protein [Cohaesibacter gelatinilyticus]SNZ06263.1 hypothetical protein SAMN06265368_0361 [Cohaesibacter gelatinilyticus]HAT86440.1 hypothetical protein [Hyphomicrobiales bacterium]